MGGVSSNFVRERQIRLLALVAGEPCGGHTCTSVCAVRPAIPENHCPNAAENEVASGARPETTPSSGEGEAAIVSAKPSHQRFDRSA